MERERVTDLDDRRTADTTECERLRRRLYELISEWEPLMARHREIERQFVDDDLRVRRGSRQGEPLTASGRRRRLRELLELDQRVCHIQSALGWIERRRVRLLEKLVDARRASR